MASLTTLRERAVTHLERAIRHILEPASADRFDVDAQDLPPEAHCPPLDLHRHWAVESAWQARKMLRDLDIELAEQKWKYTRDDYYGGLDGARDKIAGNNIGVARHEMKAVIEKARTADAARRYRAADGELRLAVRDMVLMRGGWRWVVASGGFRVAVVLAMIASGAAFFGLHGINELPAAQARTLPGVTTSAVAYIGNSVEQAGDFIGKLTKLLEALKNLFSVIPALIGAVGGSLTVLAKRAGS